jgi:hypothetical protein
VKGNLESMLGSGEIADGKVRGNKISATAGIEFQGQSLKLNLSGTVDGNSMSGTVNTPMIPMPVEFKGMRSRSKPPFGVAMLPPIWVPGSPPNAKSAFHTVTIRPSARLIEALWLWLYVGLDGVKAVKNQFPIRPTPIANSIGQKNLMIYQ